MADIRAEALFSQIAFGDAALARSDILKLSERIAEMRDETEISSGLLSFVPMIWDYYVYTGDEAFFRLRSKLWKLSFRDLIHTFRKRK